MYLLDTNIICDMARRPTGRAVTSLQRVGLDESLVTSVIVAGEIQFGLSKSGSRTLARQVEAVVAALKVLPVDRAVSDTYGVVRAALERAGTLIGSNDTWIAAHALSLGATLITGNEREFRRVPDLSIENWLVA